MPNYQDDAQNQRQQSPGRGSTSPQKSRKPIRQSAGTPRRSYQSPPPTPGVVQPRPERYMQTPSSDEWRNDPQQGDYGYAPEPERTPSEPFGLFEYVMLGAIFFLLVVIVSLVIYLLGNHGPLNSPNFSSVLVLMLLYALTVGAGYLWGRRQSSTAASRENVQLTANIAALQGEIVRLTRENSTLQNQLKIPPAKIPAPTTPGAPMPVVVTQPKPIEQVGPPPSLYENQREPDDPSDIPNHPHFKVFPEQGYLNTLRYGWRIYGASRRGYGHGYEGKYREDDFNIKLFGIHSKIGGPTSACALVAIADGVSSKKLSRRGARAAVLGATSLHEERVQALLGRLGKDTYDQFKAETQALLIESLTAARYSVENQANQSKAAVDDLQSTLLVFLALPTKDQQIFVASMQVGDGALFVLEPRRGTTPREIWRWLQQPQIQATGNEVQPFMRTNPIIWEASFKADLLESATCIMGMTDGVADDIEPPRATPENRDPDPFIMVDDFYQRIIVPPLSKAQPEGELLGLLGYQKRQSFDDRTVICLYHS